MNVFRIGATTVLAALIMVMGVLVAVPAMADGETFVVDTVVDEEPVVPQHCGLVPAPTRGQDRCSLREAIVAANQVAGPDVVSFAPEVLPGTFVLSIATPDNNPDSPLTGDLDITDAVTIDGLDQVTVDASGLWDQEGGAGDRVFDINADTGVEVHLEGMEVTGGVTEEEQLMRQVFIGFHAGGGIRIGDGDVTLEDLWIHDNIAEGYGGGVALYGGATLGMQHLTVENNVAFSGGGISLDPAGTLEGPVTLHDSTVQDNAIMSSGFRGFPFFLAGGGVASSTAVDIQRTGLLDNGELDHDIPSNGYIVTSDATPRGTGPDVYFAGPPFEGGGLYLADYTYPFSVLSESLVDGNVAGAGGGVASVDHQLLVSDSTIANNTAAFSMVRGYGAGGGALFTYGFAEVSLANTTITGNTASQGGAILSEQETRDRASFGGSSVDLLFTTVADNTTTSEGSADLVLRAGDAMLYEGEGYTFYSSILESAGTTCLRDQDNPERGAVANGFFSYDGNANPDGTCLDLVLADDLIGPDAEQDLGALAANGSSVVTDGATMWPGSGEVVPTMELRAGSEGIDAAAPVRERPLADRGYNEATCGFSDTPSPGPSPGPTEGRALLASFSFETDERAEPRPSPAGDPSACDRGAFERQPQPTSNPGPTPSRDAALAKTGPTMAAPGDEITYTLVVTSSGGTLTDVTITDPLADGIAFVSASPGCAEDGGTVTCDVGTLTAGQQATVTITVAVEGEGSVTNTACVDIAQTDRNDDNDCATHVVDVDDTMRVDGPARVETAVAGAQAAFEGGAADAVVLSRQDDFPDSQVGTPLAIALNAPMLLTQSDVLSAATEAEILRILPIGGTVYLLGGEAAIAPAVAQRLGDIGYVIVRLGGANRFDTATIVADFLGNPSTVLLADGGDFRPSIIAGAAATQVATTRGLDPAGAVLLSDGESLPGETAAYLATHAPGTVTIGDAAGAAMPDADQSVTGEGADGLSVAVAEAFFDSPTAIGVATDADFPDGLIGGAIVNLVATGPMMLTGSESLSPAIGDYLTANLATVSRALIFGGTAALAPQVEADLDAILLARR